MISSKNIPTNFQSNNSDFTIDHYKELLRLAEKNWNIVYYEAIPWGSRFLLWRHDIDYSINRLLPLQELRLMQVLCQLTLLIHIANFIMRPNLIRLKN